jgi:hypothetical protein
MRREDGLSVMEVLIILAALAILVGIVAMSVQDIEAEGWNRGLKPRQGVCLGTMAYNLGSTLQTMQDRTP